MYSYAIPEPLGLEPVPLPEVGESFASIDPSKCNFSGPNQMPVYGATGVGKLGITTGAV